MSKHIQKTVGARFPGYDNIALGAFMFLRFFNTAVAVPESYGLLKSITFLKFLAIIVLGPPGAQLRRELTLVSKVLQNLSGQVQFGAKENFMKPFNGFIEDNIPVINKFYDDIAVK